MPQWKPPDYGIPDDYWEPPDYGIPDDLPQQAPVAESGGISNLWDYINTPTFTAPSRAASYVSEPLMRYGENTPGMLGKAASYGGAFTQGVGDFFSNYSSPLNIGLLAVSGGSNALAKAAVDSTNFANKIRLANLARAMEVPGQIAGGGMVVHGGIKALDPEAPWDERLSGVVEGILGSSNLRSRVTVPKMDILPPTPKGGPAGTIPKSTPEPIVPGGGQALQQIPKYIDKPSGLFGSSKTRVWTGLPETQVQPSEQNWQPPPYGIASQEPEFYRVPPEEPQFARTESGKAKIGVDVKHAAGELTTGYSRPLPEIMVREGLQNAIDATKSMGERGDVKVFLQRETIEQPNRLTIMDNGKGMSPDELYTVYTNLHSSGKATDPNATGGKGVGKAAYMLGGGHFEVATVKEIKGKKIQSTFSGTPDELMMGFDIETTEVPPETPTGTKFTTSLKKGQSYEDMNWSLNNILTYSRGQKIKLGVRRGGSYEPNEAENFVDQPWINDPFEKKVLSNTQVDEHGTRMDAYIPSSSVTGKHSSINVKVLNNGMYQFNDNIWLGEEVQGVPKEIIVDIKPKVEEGTEAYPFPIQRESFKESAKAKIEQVIKNEIVSPMANKKSMDLVKLWDSMTPVSQAGKGFTVREAAFFDGGKKLTPVENKLFRNSNFVVQTHGLIDQMINEILEDSRYPEWGKRVVRTGIMLQDPGYYGVHIPNPHDPRNQSAIFLNPFAHMVGSDPMVAAVNFVTTALHEAAHVGTEALKLSDRPKLTSEDILDPRVGIFLQTYLSQVVEQGGVDMSHGMPFLKRLAYIYSRTGTQKGIGYATRFEKLLAGGGEPGRYSPEVQRLLHIYQESRGREATQEDILSGTGVKSKAPKGGKGSVPGDDNPNGDRTAERVSKGKNRKKPIPEAQANIPKYQEARGRLLDAIKLGLEARRKQDIGYSIERAIRAGEISDVKTPGIKGYYERLGLLKGELPKVPSESQLSPEDVDNLLDAIVQSDLRPYEQLNAQTGLIKLASGTAPQISEVKLLSKIFGNEIEQLVMMHGGLGLVSPGNLFNSVVNLPKSVMATMDVSAPFRQGLPLITRPEYWSAFTNMFSMVKSEEAFLAQQSAFLEDPAYQTVKDAGVFLAGIDDDIGNREEQYLSPLAEKIPGFGRFIVKPSERAYIGFLNQLRFNTAKSLISDAAGMGHDLYDNKLTKRGKIIEVPSDLLTQIGDFVNTASGRGDLKNIGLPGLNRISTELNAVIFSPKLMASRLTMLNPKYYVDAHPFVRRQALKALLSAAGAGLLMAAALRSAGADVSTDSTSSDFGKAKFGRTRVDTYGGFQQPVVAASRLIQGKSTSAPSTRYPQGKTYQLGKTFTGPTSASVIGNYAASRESPAASFIHTMLLGDQAFPPDGTGQLATELMGMKGKQQQVSAEVINRFTPMMLGDLIDIYRSDPNLLPLGILGEAGMGLQTFGPPSTAEEPPPFAPIANP